MFGPMHIIMLIIATTALFTLFRYQQQLRPYRKEIRIIMGATILISHVALTNWYLSTDNWTTRASLPLELCSISAIIIGIIALARNIKMIRFFYFLAVGGALQALATPDLVYGPLHFRFWQFFLDHTLLILIPCTMLILYKIQLRKRDIIYAWLTLNGIAAIVFMMNLLLDANYMFLRNKPLGTSLLDYLGPYPDYLLALEGVSLLFFIILYLPFRKH